MKKLSSLFITLLLSLGLIGLSRAQVYIQGPMSGVLEDTTYIVTDDIFVPEGRSLIIQPGATFLFQPVVEFDVYGYLCAVGNEMDSIKFMPNAGVEFWWGIDFNDSASDSSILAYCYITGSHYCGIYCDHASPTISHCTVHDNWSVFSGGGIYCYNYSNPTIVNCIISENSCYDWGGGIACRYYSSPYIINCAISRNFGEGPFPGEDGYGGGIWCQVSSSPTIMNCGIYGNSSLNQGAGITCDGPRTVIRKCTIFVNNAILPTWNPCGVCIYNPSTMMDNCIIWGNSPQQISGDGQITYSDIQGGWPGLGNIDEDPLFVMPEQEDFRLQWDSPCIDSGDPDPIYNDPDGTRADMGAFYFDQSLPVRLLLTPHDAPISIPPEGGSFDFTIQATNIDTISHLVNVWCNVTLPNGQIVGPVLGPVSIEIGSEVTVASQRTQVVPTHAPGGLYHYNGYAVVESDTSTDSFVFYKQGMGGGQATGGWSNWGEDFTTALWSGSSGLTERIPSDFALLSCHPNPCNPTTTLRFELRDESFVELSIYDISGIRVAQMVNGWREAGHHEITFDGSKLPSGVYIVKLTTATCSVAHKIVLLK